MLAAMGYPPRARESTVRHPAWLDYLSGRIGDDLPTVEAVTRASAGR